MFEKSTFIESNLDRNVKELSRISYIYNEALIFNHKKPLSFQSIKRLSQQKSSGEDVQRTLSTFTNYRVWFMRSVQEKRTKTKGGKGQQEGDKEAMQLKR